MNTAWRESAACARLENPDVMFPDAYGPEGISKALAVCRSCPVKRDCIEDALTDEGGRGPDSRYGIRGGRTPQQRFKIYQSRRPSAQSIPEPRPGGRKAAPCGTPAAYDRHCRDKEPIDDACRDAHNEKNRAQKARQKAAKEKMSA